MKLNSEKKPRYYPDPVCENNLLGHLLVTVLRFLLTFARIRLINATKRNQEVTVPGVVARLGIKTRLSDLQQAHVVLIPLTSARFIFLQPGQIEFTSRQGGARPSFFRLIRPLYTASYSPDSACARTIKTKPRRTCHDR